MRTHVKNAAARKLEPQQIPPAEIAAMQRRLQEIDDQSKTFGCRMGLIGNNGMKVWRYLAYAYVAKGWACFPSYRHIAEKTKLARSTVILAARRLRRVGALWWKQRRAWKNGKYVQGTNVFKLFMPRLEAVKELPVWKTAQQAVSLVKRTAKRLCSKASGSDYRLPGTMTDNKSSIAARCALARERKAERLRREQLVLA